MGSGRKSGVQIAWKTVTYRSVALIIIAIMGVLAIGARLAFPDFTQNTVKAATNLFENLLERVAAPADSGKGGTGSSQQAHITALDGTVRIKKASSNTWVKAEYSVPLEKGDVIQTGSEGMAKIVFNDGTNYTVKQDSLIVIEENSANDQQQTNVSVAVTTGTVDLTTATYVQGSKSQVIVAGAKASLAPDSPAMVHNNPRDDKHEILVKKGSGEIERKIAVDHANLVAVPPAALKTDSFDPHNRPRSNGMNSALKSMRSPGGRRERTVRLHTADPQSLRVRHVDLLLGGDRDSKRPGRQPLAPAEPVGRDP